MESTEKATKKGKKHPRVPIKTYKWEDVYRSRRKGGYPWTHLYKEPFGEELYPEQYTMDALRRSKSNSTFDKSERSDGVEIEEIFDDESNLSTTGSTAKQCIEVTEPDVDSKSDRLLAPKRLQIFTIESAESLDNISQYLDNEPEKENVPVKTKEQASTARATSEEPRKRRLSGESSHSKYSRLSLPKFTAFKKFTKRKLPKITFPTSNIKRSKPPKKSSPPQTKKQQSKGIDYANVKAEYIHIPLKPPAGEEDEFSYLEFGEKKPEVAEPPRQPSFRDLVKVIKAVEDAKKATEAEGIEIIDFTLQEPEDEKAEKVPTEKVQEEDIKKDEEKKTFPKLFKLDGNAKSKKIASEPLKYNTTKTNIRIPLHSEESMEGELDSEDVPSDVQVKNVEVKETEKILDSLVDEPKVKEKSKKSLSKLFKKAGGKKEIKKEEPLKYNTTKTTIRIPLHSEESMDNGIDATTLESEIAQEPKEIKDSEMKEEKPKIVDVEMKEELKIVDVEMKEPELKVEVVEETKVETIEMKEPESIVEQKEEIQTETKTESFPTLFKEHLSKKQSKKIASEPLKYNTTKSKIRIPLHSEESMDNGLETDTTDSEDIKIEPTQQLEEILAKKLKEKISSPSVDETEPESEPEITNDMFDKLFEKPPPPPETSYARKQNVRAKSAEPERKRKMSMESSYSKKSTTSTLKKKMKNMKDKIKFPSLGNLLPKKAAKPEKKEEVPETSTKHVKKELKPTKFTEPVYVHIPLKPPEGQVDQYSHLEHEEKIKVNVDVKKPDEESTMSSPDSVKEGVQFIYLTAPSDDEILDAPDVPDTPSSDKFFGSDIIELKVLAKDIVDEISPETKRKVLDSVKEEISDDKSDEFDKEDGLKISGPESSKAELKSNLKQEGSPLLNRKKVSFKRRSKDSKDDDYEEVSPSDDNFKKSTQSLTLPEQEHAKDENIKEDLFSESAPKWSDPSDHEYEPVNPPPEETKAPQPQPQQYMQQQQIIHQPLDLQPQDNIMILETREEVAVIPIIDSVSPPITTEKHVTVTTHETPLPSSYISSSQSSRARSEDLEEDLDSAPKESKFKNAMKIKADQFKAKLHSIKKPNIHLPNRPKFQKPNMEKFKLNFPKIPDTIKINLPHRSTTKIIKERQESTESNVGDSKKHTFDFKTYPRFFKRKSTTDTDTGMSSQVTSSGGRSKSVERSAVPSGYEGSGESEAKKTFDFSTFPKLFKKTVHKQDSQKLSSSDSPSEQPMRSKSYDRDIIRVPLHSEDSMENGYHQKKPEYHIEDNEENNSSSLIRYNEDIDIEDDYNRENVEVPDDFTNRWSHGRFVTKVTDLDSPGSQNPNESFDMSHNTDPHSSQSSIDVRRRGVLEEINSDEFFLRQKGISQDNIEVGKYLSSEIKEAFKIPKNSLSDLQRENYEGYDMGSNQSLPEQQAKKKPARKSRRKKTPHASEEQMKYHEYDLDVENQEQPTRPRRTSSKSKNIDVLNETDIREIMQRYASDSFDRPYYENEKMRNINQPDIYLDRGSDDFNINYASDFDRQQPQPPPRKHRSMKSLNMSEHESIMGDFEEKHGGPYQGSYADEGYEEDNKFMKKYLETAEDIPPVRPKRRSNSRSKSSQNRSTSEIKSIPDFEPEEPVEKIIEEPCVKVLGDYMGYSIVNKSQRKDPPLPPPRTPPRRRRSLKSNSSERFSTVPRSSHDGPPTRPLRNYSTLGHVRSSHKNSLKDNNNEKENIDMSQYLEIEDDDASKSLVSGEVIQKMANRPLPAPPRPPRSKTHKTKPLKDITSQQNLVDPSLDDTQMKVEEKEISTQTEPVPEEECVEIHEEVIKPVQEVHEEVCVVHQEPKVEAEKPKEIIRERVLVLPGLYSFEETITHGSLVVEPLNGAKILDDSEFTKQERIVPVTVDSDDEDSKVPDEFYLLKDPEPAPSRKKREAPRFEHIDELDVGRLRVHELMADKLAVSEIDADTINVNQLNAKSGTIEIPQGVIDEMIKKAKSEEVKYETIPEKKDDDSSDKKKRRCSSENLYLEIEESIDHSTPPHYYEEPVPPTPPPRAMEAVQLTLEDLEAEIVPSTEIQELTLELESEITDSPHPSPRGVEVPVKPPRKLEEVSQEPPTPPPRAIDEIPLRPPRQNKTTDNSDAGTIAEPEIDDQPPPRPPQPTTGYIPSQPPASFYALRAQKYVDSQMGEIPSAPRRRRHQRRVSRSTSEESLPVHPSRKHLRSSEPSIPQLTGQLIRACGSAGNSALKRLIAHIQENVVRNQDGQQDMHVIVIILLVLIAGLLLLGFGDDKTVVHLHHWEYFNPPKDM